MSTPDPSDRPPLLGWLLGLAVPLGAAAVSLAVLGAATALGALSIPVTGPFGPVAGVLCGAAVVVPIALAVALWLRRRVTVPLDRAFAALDPSPRRFLWTGRAWLGTHAGRDVQVTLLRGPLLQVTVAADARARLVVGPPVAAAAAVAGGMGLAPVVVPGEDLQAFAADPGWATGLLGDARARARVRRLLAPDDLSAGRTLDVHADCLLLTLRTVRAAPSPAEVAGWLEDLAALADGAEALPPPDRPSRPGFALRPAPLRVPPRAG